MQRLIDTLLWIWQFPQNVVGLALRRWWRKNIFSEIDGNAFVSVPGKHRIYYAKDFPGGISLGAYVIGNYWWKTYHWRRGQSERHEMGHCKQSLYLGPLYLLVIGLPSLIHAWTYKGSPDGYYKFFTESWADRLGGVKRF